MRSAFFLTFIIAIGCTQRKEPSSTFIDSVKTPSAVIDTIKDSVNIKKTIVEDTLTEINITYHAIPLTEELIQNIDPIYTPEQFNIILALNRIDIEHLRRCDSLVIPDTFLTFQIYSPFPDSLPFISDIKKMLLFSYPIQAFAVYENGLQIKWGPVSMGKESTPTPTGLFSTNWKSKETVSTVDSEWVMKWYFNLINFKGVSMHEYDLPGFPASHACVRLLEEDAKWLYDWADQWVLSWNDTIIAYGTPVFIYGEYPFGERKPWMRLREESQCMEQNADSLQFYLDPYLPLIRERQAMKEMNKNIY